MFWEPAALSIAAPLALGLLIPRSNARRIIIISIILFFGVRYTHWRLAQFPWSTLDLGFESAWWILVLIVELLVLLEVFLFLASITWLTNRTPLADKCEHAVRSRFAQNGQGAIPSADVLITTYNEGPEVIEKSILGAAQIDYPNYTTWVLDDGDRGWLKEFCERVGVHYIARESRTGAKAGNINHALQLCQGELVMILDADFIPYPNSLWRLAGLFDDPQIATVQTPQNFFNPDAIQHNLGISRSWADEQSFFFRKIARGRDALGVAFCCGSCSIHRRTALDSIAGFPTQSITEDILLTVNLCRMNWRTIYLAEPLTMGLAAESLTSFFIQRKRWARGGIQVAWLMLKQRGLKLIQRIFFFPYSWITQYSSRLFFQCVPIIFFFFRFPPLPDADAADLINYQLPFLLTTMVGLTILAEGYYLPIFSEAINLFAAFELAPEILAAIVHPFGKGFAVTPKGDASLSSRHGIYRTFIWPVAILLGLNLVILIRVCLAVGETIRSTDNALLYYGLAWSVLNVILLIACLALCVEKPQPRREHRIELGLPVDICVGKEAIATGTLLNISMSGARIQLSGDCDLSSLNCNTNLRVSNTYLPASMLFAPNTSTDEASASLDVVAQFDESDLEIKRSIIELAFNGRYAPANQPQAISLLGTIRGILQWLFG
jgi:cellulose synthase (UDP-forming)